MKKGREFHLIKEADSERSSEAKELRKRGILRNKEEKIWGSGGGGGEEY